MKNIISKKIHKGFKLYFKKNITKGNFAGVGKLYSSIFGLVIVTDDKKEIEAGGNLWDY
jgi:hypothetical protein